MENLLLTKTMTRADRQPDDSHRNNPVYVFQTDIATARQLRRLGAALTPYPQLRWSVDMEDVDRVLRVESDGLTARQIQDVTQRAGIACRELS